MDLLGTSSTCTLFCGPMGSGKTTALLAALQYLSFNKDARVLCVGNLKDIPRQVERAESRKRLCTSTNGAEPPRAQSVPVRADDDDADAHVETHLGNRSTAYLCLELKSVLKLPEYACADAIGIDEGHMFPDLVDFVTVARKRDNKHVVVAALDTDSDMHAFEQVHELMLQCTKIKKKNGICAYCMSPSAHTIHLGPKDAQMKIGGFECYKPVCFRHAIADQEDLPPLRSLRGAILPRKGAAEKM
jgi:thymidine kinase